MSINGASAVLGKNNAEKMLDIAIRECIGKLSKLLEQYPDEKHMQQFRDVKKRYEDPELKLAVIGEFNTGKSTFINALLGKDFLSTDNVPTTVIPTYIRWDGKIVDHPVIKIKFVDSDREYNIEKNREILEKKLKMELGRDDDLERITTNNDLIGVVSHVSASFPADKRFKNFCLIDTPGSNPGAEETKEHANITRGILREEADATIILFPANVTGNRSALEFISENASHLLGGAAFVITKKDMIATEAEIEKIIKYLKGLVKQRYELDDQTIYTCSARNAIRAGLAGDTDDSFLQDFNAMVGNVLNDLGKKRKQLIFRKVTKLLGDMLTDLRQEQIILSQRLKSEAEAFEQYSLKNLQKEYNVLSLAFRKEMDIEAAKRIASINSQVTAKTQFAVSGAEFDMRSLDGIFAVKDYAGEGIKSRLSKFEDSIKDGIRNDAKQLEKIYGAFSQKVFECLKSYELQITSELKQDGKENTEVETPKVALEVSVDGVIGGLGLGALLLLCVNPTVLVAALAAGIFFGSALVNWMKKTLLGKIESCLKSAGSGIEQKWKEALMETKCRYLLSAETLMNDYQQHYDKVFRARVAADEQERKRINSEVRKVNSFLRQIDTMEAALKLPGLLEACKDVDEVLLDKAADGDIQAMNRICGIYQALRVATVNPVNYELFLKWSAFAQLCEGSVE